jgi:5-methylcytosine-specific restriction endonuclease McrA
MPEGVDPRRVDQRARDSVISRVLAEESVCHLCFTDVDKTIPAGLPAAPEVDEIIPVSLGGDPLDRSNCHLAHKSCNARRGNMSVAEFHRRYLRQQPLVTSHDW